RGISSSEKTARLLSFFHDSKSFFAIKEVEKLGSKATGINSMQIKEVLQGLVDESLVRCEKIGSGNYYWSFLSDATKSRELVVSNLKKKLETETEAVVSLEEQTGIELSERENNAERDDLLRRVQEKEDTLRNLQQETSKYSDVDPELLQQQTASLSLLREAANCWTDNIFAVLGYFRAQGTDLQIIYREFGIPDDLDSI
ncbi:meiotic nuclear division protein 1, partial [Myxozyma melibiosi]